MSCCGPPTILSERRDTLVSKCEIPIIDLGHMGTERCPQKGVLKQVASKLVRALSEKGAAFLVNHGIPECKIKAAYRAFDTFCELPKESRAKFERVPPCDHGYILPEADQYSSEEKESRHEFIVTSIDDALPDEDVPSFRVAVNELTRDFKQLSAMLLTALSIGIDQPPDYFVNKHANILDEGNESALRMMYYPPSCLDKGSTKYGPCCDIGTFTLFAQDAEGGLEIQAPHSQRWGHVGHLPGAILVNSGECLAKWTSQKLSPLKHRVVVPENCRRGRHSIGFFVYPDENVVIDPLDIKIPIPIEEPVICRMQKKKRGVLNAYHHLQRRFRETYAS
ncbi:hypothetical protein HCN44_008981 [Aphidius gifuensis]|uniref:Fe2OG dioxygenase domain-containing protein n=1 Tax=Aphidius gifuensis TaxID=684658 RepID=A0A835CSU1_APHGI|nr:2-oxoglutarate-Fe(II) type oxidoreductase ppzD-like [Aphidius gifuensis]KAF7991610.1 hypothetical protein HCN44_008981 [Aphidius gifuensis]